MRPSRCARRSCRRSPRRLQFEGSGFAVEGKCRRAGGALRPADLRRSGSRPRAVLRAANGCSPEVADDDAPVGLESLATLKPVGQIRDSFILAVNPQGLWIIDQHVAHERMLFEKICKQRLAESPEKQQLLMPLIVELTPGQMAVFAEISDELNRNGFEVEPFGSRTIAVKTTAAGVDAGEVEHLLHEMLEQFEREEQALNLDKHSHQHRRQHRLPRRHQGQHAAGAEQNGVAAARAGENRLPHELSAWPAGGSAVFC